MLKILFLITALVLNVSAITTVTTQTLAAPYTFSSTGDGTYVFTGGMTTAGYEVDIDNTAGSVYLKSSGTNGMAITSTTLFKTLGNYPVYFTSINDDTVGATYSGSNHSPKSTDQSYPYFYVSSAVGYSVVLKHVHFKFHNGAALPTCGWGGSASATGRFELDTCTFFKCIIPAGNAAPTSMVGSWGGTIPNTGSVYLDGCVFDGSDSCLDASNGYPFLFPSAITSVVRNSTFAIGGTCLVGVNFTTPTSSQVLDTVLNCYVNLATATGYGSIWIYNAGAWITGAVLSSIITNKTAASYGCYFGGTVGCGGLVQNCIFLNSPGTGLYHIAGNQVTHANNIYYNNGTDCWQALNGNEITGTNPALGAAVVNKYNPTNPLPNSFFVTDLTDFEGKGSGTFDATGINASIYSQTGKIYNHLSTITPGCYFRVLPSGTVIHKSVTAATNMITTLDSLSTYIDSAFIYYEDSVPPAVVWTKRDSSCCYMKNGSVFSFKDSGYAPLTTVFYRLRTVMNKSGSQDTSAVHSATTTAAYSTITVSTFYSSCGSVSPSGAQTVQCLHNLSIAATANLGRRFDHWAGSSNLSIAAPSSASTTVATTDSNNAWVNAIWDTVRYTVTLAKSSGGYFSPATITADSGTLYNIYSWAPAWWTWVNWTTTAAGHLTTAASETTTVFSTAAATVTANFTLSTVAATTTVYPVSGDTAKPKSLVLRWHYQAPDSAYTVLLDTAAAFNSALLQTLTPTDTVVAVNVTKDSTVYRWKVRGVNAGGNSAYSAVATFKTAAPSKRRGGHGMGIGIRIGL
jgi:hypothetical protein